MASEIDYEEEQNDEMESLQSIFESNFESLETTPPSFKLKLYPNQEEDEDEPNHVGISLRVQYVETYPSELPEITCSIIKGLKETKLKEVREHIRQAEKELTGEPFIYELTTILEEWLQENNMDPRASLFEKRQFEQKRKAEEERNLEILQNHVVGMSAHSVQDYDKSHVVDGTVITDEVFAEWTVKFMLEYRKKQAEEMIDAIQDESGGEKLTGKQLFEEKAKAQIVIPESEQNLMVFDQSLFEDDILPEEEN